MQDKKIYPHAKHRQRVRDAFRKNNIDEMPDKALLEMLLFYSIPRCDTNPTAELLLEKYGSLNGVFNADYDELIKIDGIGESSALLLSSMPGYFKRYSGISGKGSMYLNSVEIQELIIDYFRDKSEECFIMLCFDPVGKLIDKFCLAEGNEVSVTVDKKSILKTAFDCDAESVIFAHNHPFSDAAPSKSDIDLTKEAADLLLQTGIRLTDHYIYGDGEILSLSSLNKFRDLFPQGGIQ